MPTVPATPTERVAVVVSALIRTGATGATVAELATMTGVTAPACRDILRTVSRCIPVYDVAGRRSSDPARWFIM